MPRELFTLSLAFVPGSRGETTAPRPMETSVPQADTATSFTEIIEELAVLTDGTSEVFAQVLLVGLGQKTDELAQFIMHLEMIVRAIKEGSLSSLRLEDETDPSIVQFLASLQRQSGSTPESTQQQ